jgi:DNA topoisomerase-6 subunit B
VTAQSSSETDQNQAAAEKAKTRQTAESMATRQREISISEFFSKNRHLLGFDNPQKALLTAVKEAVDNSLDACEDAGILPVLKVSIQQLAEDRFRISVEDNGPGIVKAQIPKIFGKLLYGSKFHTLKQARGQQGIGISAAGMYGLLTTGKSIVVTSRTGHDKPAHYYEIQIDTRKNAPQIIIDKVVDWEPPHGTKVEIELIGTFKKGRHSVDDYIRQTAIANPHCEIFYSSPDSTETLHLERGSDALPPEPREIKPHPYGVELGVLIRMMKETPSRQISAALQKDFSRVSGRVAAEICKAASLNANAPFDCSPRGGASFQSHQQREDYESGDELPVPHRRRADSVRAQERDRCGFLHCDHTDSICISGKPISGRGGISLRRQPAQR